jgi:hypothetical protein
MKASIERAKPAFAPIGRIVSNLAMFARLGSSAVAVALCLAPAIGAAEEVYFGNLHSHTSYSDGSGTPEEAFEHAKNAGLDFLAITEHNHKDADGTGDRKDGLLIAKDHSLYNGAQSASLIATAKRLTKNGTFVALYGQEFSTISSGNHMNVFDAPEVIGVQNGEFGELITWIEAHPDSMGLPPILQFNHPALFDDPSTEYGQDDFASREDWIAALDKHVRLIEVLNGPAMGKTDGVRSASVQEKDYFFFLNLGFHVAPSTGQDNHYFTWGTITDARVAIVADSLTKESVLTALRNRHAYATEDRNLRVVFKVNGHLSGDIIDTPIGVGDTLDLRVKITDDDEPDASYRVEVFSDVPGGDAAKTPIEVFSINGNTNEPVKLEGITFKKPGQYVLLKIIQSQEHGPSDRAWTAPVWLEQSGGSPGVAPVVGAKLRIVRLVPDPGGNDAQNESVTLANQGTQSINLSGWILKDLTGNRWTLTGTIGAGQEKTIKRLGQAMSLNNDGDTIGLFDPSGNQIQVVTYGAVAPDEVFEIPHR